jgi:hypothetical protein
MQFALIVGTILGLTGAFAIAIKRYMFCQVTWLFANASLLIYNIYADNHWMIVLFSTYEIITVYAIINLLKDDKVKGKCNG